jgi:hypothetical protein
MIYSILDEFREIQITCEFLATEDKKIINGILLCEK